MAAAPDAADEALILAFAERAAHSGWRQAELARFCRERGVGAAEQKARWPRGVRSVAWELNAIADRKTARRFTNAGAGFEQLIMDRFEQNRGLKRSVRRLAWSDLFHPVGTFRRTGRTAKVMLACQGQDAGAVRLTLVYSATVLVWLADRTPDERRTRRATRWLLALAGLR